MALPRHNIAFWCLLLFVFPVWVSAVTLSDAKLAIRQKQFDEAAKILEVLASRKKADIEAQYLLGTLYRNGSGVEQSHSKAFGWFSHAASGGHVKSQYALATMYENGWGTGTSVEQALYWYEISAEGGHRQSLQRLEALQENDRVANEAVSTEAAFQALRNDDSQLLRIFLTQSKSPNVKNDVGRTLLAEAMILHADQCFDAILEHNPELENMDSGRDSAVSLALRLHRMNHLKKILRLGPELGFRDSTGNSLVSLAVKQGSAEAVKILLSAGAPHSLPDEAGFSALDIAEMAGKQSVVQLLQAAGAEHSQQYVAMQETADATLDVTLQIKQLDILRRENASYSGWPLLHIAAYQGKSEVVARLLDEGASPLETTPAAESALHVVIKGGDLESLRYLYTSLPNNALDALLLTDLLKLAVREKQEAQALFLLRHLSIAQRVDLQLDPLMPGTCSADMEALTNYLIERRGRRPARGDNDALVDTLLCAIERNWSAALLLLLAQPDLGSCAGAADRKPLLVAAAKGSLDTVGTLLESGVDPECSDDSGVTALIAASTAGQVKVVGRLLSGGAKIDKVDKSGLAALHHAIAANQPVVAELLLESGASPGLRDGFSRTPLMYAAEQGALDVVKLLVTHGAQVNRRDSKGRTASRMAELNNNQDVLVYLNSLI